MFPKALAHRETVCPAHCGLGPGHTGWAWLLCPVKCLAGVQPSCVAHPGLLSQHPFLWEKGLSGSVQRVAVLAVNIPFGKWIAIEGK